MKMIYYEMKKSWFKISILFLLVFFCILSGYKICGMYNFSGRFRENDDVKTKEAYLGLYGILSGEITEEKNRYINEIYKELDREVSSGNFSTEYNEDSLTGYTFADYMLIGFNIIPELEYAVTYPNLSDRICNDAYENILFFNEHKNYSEAKKNALIYKLYQNREIISYNLTEWVEYYFKYDFSSLLIIIMIIVGLGSSFSLETESGMNILINTSGAAYKTANAKLISAGVYILLITVIFGLFDFFTVKYLCGADGFSNPLYSAYFFRYTPYNFSLLQAMIVCSVIKLLAFIVIGEITVLISALIKKTILALCADFMIIVLFMLHADKNSLMVNPINMLSPYRMLEKFDCRFIGGEPVLSVYYYAMLYIVMIILLFVCIKLAARSGQGAQS